MSLFFLLISCEAEIDDRGTARNVPQKSTISKSTSDTLIVVDNIKVRMIQRANAKGNLLLLPGWNFPIDHWADSTKLLVIAEERQFNVIMPEMGKSIYSRQIYDVTHADYRDEKTLKWLTDTLIPRIQEYDLLQSKQYVLCVGISTGARGAVALKLERNDIVDDVLALSGDYSTMKFPQDNLYKRYFGNLEGNKVVWQKEDLTSNTNNIEGRITLYHGKRDAIVPYRHSSLLYDSMFKKKVNCSLLIREDFSHDYLFWNTAISDYFQSN
jgi:pimeloyl-ACP methyl ester carboxylesterase